MLDDELAAAVMSGEVERVRVLLSQGADPNTAFGADGDDPVLVTAAIRNFGDIAELLVISGARVNGKSKVSGTTALMWAAMFGSVDVVRVLVDKGAALDEKNAWGNFALGFAAAQGHGEVVRLLLGSGADPIQTDNGKNTALAGAEKYPDIVEMLNAAIKNREDIRQQKAAREAAREQVSRHREILRQKKPTNPPKWNP